MIVHGSMEARFHKPTRDLELTRQELTNYNKWEEGKIYIYVGIDKRSIL